MTGCDRVVLLSPTCAWCVGLSGMGMGEITFTDAANSKGAAGVKPACRWTKRMLRVGSAAYDSCGHFG